MNMFQQKKISANFRLYNKAYLNVIVEWLALLLQIWEVLGSDLGLETGCPD
jgi:hypothetical protein